MVSTPISIELTRELLDNGLSRYALAQSAREGTADLMRLCQGAYVRRVDFRELNGSQQHRVRVCALHLTGRLRPGAVLARESAAVVYGIPLIGPLPERVQLVRVGRTGGRRTTATRTLPAPDDYEVIEKDGLPIASVAQTLVDLGRRRCLASNLTSLDHALRQGWVTKEHLLELIDRHPGTRGNGPARRWIELADPQSESPGESLSRAVMIENHLPLPELQHKVVDERGAFLGRVDFIWPELGVIGEFDGRVKYGRELSRGKIEDVIERERRREIAIEQTTGMRLVRWMWGDIWGSQHMLQLLADAGVRPTH
ncbi:hypothetical protein [Actinomyces faecalis]|uniref:hypothetical protein n=1 Tax=Actinomyces faecalis TaxID=2722820 RepID=UPI001557CCF8|nr:hypothetical protein [Actinomyces faecalis]